ncbi:MAG: glucose-1-phosphate adenylyltransferase [Oscillospiraceae bacterium]|jgi:glucose-1-phosphate adenylyltransferase|nr:glucose-1-phosphate adenylyltransferase [Oscillospiraceae bacterium]
MRRKECVAMLLAGGQGSRLYVLTANVAKPAVPFGGKYRIIDFPLSNCVNSNIDTVGVLTQYQPHELNAYIGAGLPWDLDRLEGGVRVLPPYVKGKGGEWYKGTANAIYQNMGFIETYDPEYVLILSGDHIYKMDYAQMINQHRRTQADCTIAVIEVPADEACRFGILNADADGVILDFEEKPKKPKSNLASMGVYVFTWSKLRAYLLEDNNNPKSRNDFGSNIIPMMLNADERMLIYQFKGYWKDVGTIESLWEANMDMLATDSELDIFDRSWPIYCGAKSAPPHFVGESARITHSLLTEGCEIHGEVENSVIFTDVVIQPGAFVKYSIVMPGAVIEKEAVVEYAIIAEGARVGRGARVGADPSVVPVADWGVTVVAQGVTVGPDVVVKTREMVGADKLTQEADPPAPPAAGKKGGRA